MEQFLDGKPQEIIEMYDRLYAPAKSREGWITPLRRHPILESAATAVNLSPSLPGTCARKSWMDFGPETE